MIKVSYKPLGLRFGVLGGLAGNAVFTRVWKLLTGRDEAPAATPRGLQLGPCSSPSAVHRRRAAKHRCPATGRARLGYDRARVLLDRHTWVRGRRRWAAVRPVHRRQQRAQPTCGRRPVTRSRSAKDLARRLPVASGQWSRPSFSRLTRSARTMSMGRNRLASGTVIRARTSACAGVGRPAPR